MRKALPKAQYILPKRALTSFAGALANRNHAGLTHRLISRFVARYGVNLAEAAEADIRRYGSFNDFFSRSLRPGARTISNAPYVCPVDGILSEYGDVEGNALVQAKGRQYTTSQLLAGDPKLCHAFQRGGYVTLYLSPKDYHRVHMPCDGRLEQMIYVPGHLFSVNPRSVEAIPRIFARNERVICVFSTHDGPLAVVFLVGATIVGSIATVWHGLVKASLGRRIERWDYKDESHEFRKGAEIGRFLIGSTVILLTASRLSPLNLKWHRGAKVLLGEAMFRSASTE